MSSRWIIVLVVASVIVLVTGAFVAYRVVTMPRLDVTGWHQVRCEIPLRRAAWQRDLVAPPIDPFRGEVFNLSDSRVSLCGRPSADQLEHLGGLPPARH